jgi:hypothetical protein
MPDKNKWIHAFREGVNQLEDLLCNYADEDGAIEWTEHENAVLDELSPLVESLQDSARKLRAG